MVNNKRYSVATATLIASDAYWDGHNEERSGGNTFLYRTPSGNYFTVTLSLWQGESDALEPATLGEAIKLFEHGLSEHKVHYAEAFPGMIVTPA
jgi:hypothetical protein